MAKHLPCKLFLKIVAVSYFAACIALTLSQETSNENKVEPEEVSTTWAPTTTTTSKFPDFDDENVESTGSVSPAPAPPTVPEEPIVFGKECKSEPEYIYPNPKNCSMFYKCWRGKLYPIPCPEPLVFNTELLVCDWTWNVTTCDPGNMPSTDYGLG